MSSALLDLVRDRREQLVEVLQAARASGSAVPAAKLAQRLLKGIHDDLAERTDWACRRGCSFCCHNAVSVSAPEAFRLAASIRRLPAEERAALEAGIRTRQAEVAALSIVEQATRRMPCALLAADGACRQHAERPLPCIGFVSYDRAACERAFNARSAEFSIPTDRGMVSAAGAHNLALRLACRDLGLAYARYELHDALVVALDDPDAERRWLAGEDPFAGCRVDRTSAGPQADADLDYFAKELG